MRVIQWRVKRFLKCVGNGEHCGFHVTAGATMHLGIVKFGGAGGDRRAIGNILVTATALASMRFSDLVNG